MGYPYVKIDLRKIAENARLVTTACGDLGIEVVGVTKACCANIAVAEAMLAGGGRSLGDARGQKLKQLRKAGIDVPLMLLRIPMVSEAAEVVSVADCSLVSELVTVEELSKAAISTGRIHSVVVMVDMGDLREGVVPQQILPFIRQVLKFPGIRLRGLGANFACYAGLAPTPALLQKLVELAECTRETYGIDLPVVSGGNSANMGLIMARSMPPGINQLRIGEAILLGRETVNRLPIHGAHLDAFTLHAEIVELQEKPSVPPGASGQDAFGKRPLFVDRGIRRRAIVAIGRQDVAVEGLVPIANGVEVLGGSSDHLILDVSDAEKALGVGDEIAFSLQYSALVHTMISPYVTKLPLCTTDLPDAAAKNCRSAGAEFFAP
jgi:predicted amino acid racemase